MARQPQPQPPSTPMTPSPRRWALWLLLLPLAVTALTPLISVGRGANESQIKAAFLFNFTKFITWRGAAATDGNELVIGIAASESFIEQVRELVRGHAIGVRRVSTPEEAKAMNVLFVSSSHEKVFSRSLADLHRAQVLTVGETSKFADAGGIITFHLEGDKVRFAVNRESAAAAGLKVSPQLLKLAVPPRNP